MPVTLIAGDAFYSPKGNTDPNIWPNDGIVNLSSAFAQSVPDAVIPHRSCRLYSKGTHSVYISTDAGLPADLAITWNDTTGSWVDQALQGADSALGQPNRLNCPSP